jgi:hypothetical protein
MKTVKKYLQNPICNLTPLFEIDYRRKQNIISCCFFKLREGSYKEFSKYTNGVRKLSLYVSKNFKDFRVRLFIERSIYEDEEIMKLLNSLDIDMVLYDCPDFKRGLKNHKGLFGTFLRFFPLFDFQNNDSKYVLIADIDWDIAAIDSLLFNSIIYNMTRNRKEFSYSYIFAKGVFYDKRNNYKSFINNFFYTYTLANNIMGLKKMNSLVLTKFLQDAEKSNKKFTFYEHNRSKEIESYTNFVYGVDEYFTSVILRDYLLKEKKEYFQNIHYTISGMLYYQIKNKKEDKEYKNLFNYVLQDFKNYKFVSNKESFQKLDKILYNQDIMKIYGKKVILSKMQKKVFFRLYQYYISIYNTDKVKSYNKDFLTIVLNDAFLGYPILNFGILRTFKTNKMYIFKGEKMDDFLVEKLKDMKRKYGIKDVNFKISDDVEYL